MTDKNGYKFPLMMAPKMKGTEISSENKKVSNYGKTIKFSKHALSTMLLEGKFR